jgi:hypothetical protein
MTKHRATQFMIYRVFLTTIPTPPQPNILHCIEKGVYHSYTSIVTPTLVSIKGIFCFSHMLTAFQLAAFFGVKFSDFAERKFKMAKNVYFLGF